MKGRIYDFAYGFALGLSLIGCLVQICPSLDSPTNRIGHIYDLRAFNQNYILPVPSYVHTCSSEVLYIKHILNLAFRHPVFFEKMYSGVLCLTVLHMPHKRIRDVVTLRLMYFHNASRAFAWRCIPIMQIVPFVHFSEYTYRSPCQNNPSMKYYKEFSRELTTSASIHMEKEYDITLWYILCICSGHAIHLETHEALPRV